MYYFLLIPILMSMFLLFDINEDNQASIEREAMTERILLIDKADGSDNPTVIEAGARAEREIQEIKDIKAAEIKEEVKEQERLANLDLHERPLFWYKLLAIIGCVLLIPLSAMYLSKVKYLNF